LLRKPSSGIFNIDPKYNRNHPDFSLKSKELCADIELIDNPWTERLV